jgi:hypothetical protein
MAKPFRSIPSPKVITLTEADRKRLRAAVLAESAAKATYQAQEMRLRADVMDAEVARAAVMNDLGAVHGFDAQDECAFDMAKGTLTINPPKPKS